MSEIDAAERETPYHDELTPYRSEAIDLVSYVVWSNNSTDDHEEPWRRIAKAILAAREPLIDALDDLAAKDAEISRLAQDLLGAKTLNDNAEEEIARLQCDLRLAISARDYANDMLEKERGSPAPDPANKWDVTKSRCPTCGFRIREIKSKPFVFDDDDAAPNEATKLVRAFNEWTPTESVRHVNADESRILHSAILASSQIIDHGTDPAEAMRKRVADDWFGPGQLDERPDHAPDPAEAMRAKWHPIDTAPNGRILLGWKSFGGIDEHVELGQKRGDGWVNTYGKPFSGQPDCWSPLPRMSPQVAALKGKGDGQ